MSLTQMCQLSVKELKLSLTLCLAKLMSLSFTRQKLSQTFIELYETDLRVQGQKFEQNEYKSMFKCALKIMLAK